MTPTNVLIEGTTIYIVGQNIDPTLRFTETTPLDFEVLSLNQ